MRIISRPGIIALSFTIFISSCQSDDISVLELACKNSDKINGENKAVCAQITDYAQLACLESQTIEDKSNCTQIKTLTHLACLEYKFDIIMCMSNHSEFYMSCKASGGEIINESCTCGGTQCYKGVICEQGTDGQHKCASLDCEDGVYRCQDTVHGGVIQQCSNMAWNQVDSCDINLSCKDKDNKSNLVIAAVKASTCGECLNGQAKCEEGIISICENGQWQTNDENQCNTLSCRYSFSSDIPEGYYSPDNANLLCGECLNDLTKCDKGTQSTCRNGMWKQSLSCPSGECQGDICKPQQCSEFNQTKCQNNSDNVGINFHCDANGLETIETCLSVSCNDNGCGVCLDGTYQNNCSNGEVSKCIHGDWSKEKCEGNASCTAEGLCGICKDGDIIEDCEDGHYSLCTHGEWIKSACSNGVSCTKELKCGECQNGDTKGCVNGEAQKCVHATWLKRDKCNTETEVSCTTEQKCGECQNGDTKECTNGKAIKCIDGQWSAEKVVCNEETEVSCTADGRCGECKDDTVSCSNDTDEVGKFIKCIDGTWSSEPETCPGNASCDTSNTDSTLVQCGQCSNKTEYACVEISGQVFKFSKCDNGKATGESIICPTKVCNVQECK